MTTFSVNDVDVAYAVLCRKLAWDPQYVTSPRGQKIHEMIDVCVEIGNPRARLVTDSMRNLSKRYLAGEFAFYMSGSDELEFIAHYGKFWRKVSDDGIIVNSCYGRRLYYIENVHGWTQMNWVLNQLAEDPDTRKAVAMIYAYPDSHPSKDNPCTLCLQFFIRDGELRLTTHMRSNDIWLGTPYDIAFFTMVQEMTWLRLRDIWYPNLKLGPYTHIVGSLHLYEKHIEKAKQVGDKIGTKDCRMPPMTRETLAQMEDFLKFEHSIRTNEAIIAHHVTDPFLLELLGWLI